MTLARSLLVVAAFAAVGCGAPPPKAPTSLATPLSQQFAAAFREEAVGAPGRAIERYLGVLRDAVAHPTDPWSLAAIIAPLDALVGRTVVPLAAITGNSALYFRTRNGAIEQALGGLAQGADGPFARGLFARTLEDVAIFRGDEAAAARAREGRGCAREATLVGPLSYAPLADLRVEGALERGDAPLAASYAPASLLDGPVVPLRFAARACRIELGAVGAVPGVRDVVVDAEIAEAGRIGVVLRGGAPTRLYVGGKLVVDRPTTLGDGEAAQFALVDVGAGRVRIVARAASMQGGEAIELDAFDARGRPLPLRAPRVGDAAPVRATGFVRVTSRLPTTSDERLLVGAALLGTGSPRAAERALEAEARKATTSPEVALLYLRAIDSAQDLPPVHRDARARGAAERVLAAWPSAWEAALTHAALEAARRGLHDGFVAELRDLDTQRARLDAENALLVDAIEAVVSRRAGLFDRSRGALDRASKGLSGTALLHEVRGAAGDRVGEERVAHACADTPARDRGAFACHDALLDAGELRRASDELLRLRRLYGGGALFLPAELGLAVSLRDNARVATIAAAMHAGERTLDVLALATPQAPGLRELLLGAARAAPDSPDALAKLLIAHGHDPFEPFSDRAEALAKADRASPVLPNAATAVLAHDERYDLDARGVLHGVLLDVRRVNGTTDVDQNAVAERPAVLGRSSSRLLRRRVFKRDGRVVEPEKSPTARQAHAELAQVEQGDIIESVTELWAVPGEIGDIGLDTPDLLPERVAVHDARIELRVPASLRGGIWSHALLGKPSDVTDGAVRVLRWTMSDHDERRIEWGAPRLEQGVRVRFATTRWGDLGRALSEAVAGLADDEPEVVAWAHSAAKGEKAPSKALVEAVVASAGEAIKESTPGWLADLTGLHRQTLPSATARSFLARSEGSRSWLVARALRVLGVDAEIVLSESEPYSADPAFPPHYQRFGKPLVVARLPAAASSTGAMSELWIDADVSGPPLPAGRISPELRKRSVLHTDGRISEIPELPGGVDRDEVDLRLVLDAAGNAQGWFTILLRGRDAQELAEAFFRVVGEERQRALRGVVLGWLPTASVEEVALSSSEGSWQVALRASVRITGLAQPEGRGVHVLPGMEPVHFVFPRPQALTLSTLLAPQAGRKSALGVRTAMQYHVHRRFELPATASLERVPGPFDVRTALLSGARRIVVSGNVLEDDFTLDLLTGTVPTEGFSAFARELARADAAFLATARVRLAQ